MKDTIKHIKKSNNYKINKDSKISDFKTNNNVIINSDNNNDIDTLKINTEFKKKFEYNERRKVLEKAKEKYGRDLLSASEQSDSETEDEEGDLINKNVKLKYLQTLVSLRDKNSTNNIYADSNNTKEDNVFKDEDFDLNKFTKKDKKYTVKEALIDYKEDSESYDNNINNIYDANYIPKAKEDNLKKGFIEAAKIPQTNNINGLNNKEFVDEGFLTKKNNKFTDKYNVNNSVENITNNKNNKAIITINDKKLDELDLDDILQSRNIASNDEEEKLIKQFYYGNDANNKLDKRERFLRNYILSEAWKENKNDDKINRVSYTKEDEEDSLKSDLFEDFESGYNFRFQESGGINLTTYERNNNKSMNIKESKRTEKRKEVNERKIKEKEEKLKELNAAREAKKEEHKEKINKLIKVSGKKIIDENILDMIYNELNSDEFDEDKFDTFMERLYNNDYYKGNAIDDNQDKLLNDNVIEVEEIEEVINDIEDTNENNLNNININNDSDDKWWYCDLCLKYIKQGSIKYECKTCEDYTLCKKCYKQQGHEHIMKKDKVSVDCVIPENWEELIKQAKQDSIEVQCSKCSKDISDNPHYFICKLAFENNPNVSDNCKKLIFCKHCRALGKSIHEHDMIKYKVNKDNDNDNNNDKADTQLTKQDKLKLKLDEKFNNYYTDIVSDLPIKFKYINVKADDYGLNDEMMVYLEDKSLNKYLPMKAIFPYREDKYKVNNFLLKKDKKYINKEIDRKKKYIQNEVKQLTLTTEENKKLLGNKIKKNNKNNNNLYLDEREKRRLQSYGIIDSYDKTK